LLKTFVVKVQFLATSFIFVAMIIFRNEKMVILFFRGDRI